MKKLTFLLFLSLILGSGYLLAQPGNPSTPTPFGGIIALAAAGVGYGAFKYSNQKNEKK